MSLFLAQIERKICWRKADLKHSLRISVQKPCELGEPEFRQSTHGSLHRIQSWVLRKPELSSRNNWRWNSGIVIAKDMSLARSGSQVMENVLYKRAGDFNPKGTPWGPNNPLGLRIYTCFSPLPCVPLAWGAPILSYVWWHHCASSEGPFLSVGSQPALTFPVVEDRWRSSSLAYTFLLYGAALVSMPALF